MKQIFSEKIRNLMHEKRLNMDSLSRLCGVSSASINRYVRGECLPGLGELAKLCRALNVTPNDVSGFSGHTPSSEWSDCK